MKKVHSPMLRIPESDFSKPLIRELFPDEITSLSEEAQAKLLQLRAKSSAELVELKKLGECSDN